MARIREWEETRIIHPKKKVKHLSFVASGTADPRGKRIQAIVDFLGTRAMATFGRPGKRYRGHVYQQPPHWKVGFMVERGGIYKLTVFLPRRPIQTMASVIFEVVPPTFHAGPPTITFPDNDTADANLPIDCYGTLGNPQVTAVSAEVTCTYTPPPAHSTTGCNAPFASVGTPTIDARFGLWTATFDIPTTQPDHNEYTLHVWETGNVNNDDTSTFHIDNLGSGIRLKSQARRK